MQYVSAVSDEEVRAELMNDLSGLVIGSAFLLSTPQQIERVLKLCDDAAKAQYDMLKETGAAAKVECMTVTAGFHVGFDSLKPISDLPEDAIITQVYRYFDTPREAIVAAAIAAPSEIKKTRDITFFCGPDRRKTGDYRIFSIHPGPKRQAFPNRYQPEAVRKENRDYWDRHVFLATPNQIIAAKTMMRARYKMLEPEARDRVFYMVRQMEGSLHRWYGTWSNAKREVEDFKTMMEGVQSSGDFGMAPDGTVYYFVVSPQQPHPDLTNFESFEYQLSNPLRPAILRPDGSEEYYLNGKRHREGAPALYKPEPDGGWTEIWYENGLISRMPEDGPAKIVYDANGTVTFEVSIYKGAEVQETTLGEAAAPVKALQEMIAKVALNFKWFEESVDFQLLRGQLDFAHSRSKTPVDQLIRQMTKDGEQVSLRWDIDRTLEQDERNKIRYNNLLDSVRLLGERMTEAAQAMRFVRGDPGIINAIWNKIMRDLDRVCERGLRIPGEPGKTTVDDFLVVRQDAKKFFQSMDDLNKSFSATGR